MQAFKEACQNCDLKDLGFKGPKFSWWNNRDEEAHIQCRLDHNVATTNWINSFPRCAVYTKSLGASNHLAIRLTWFIKEVLDGNEDSTLRLHG